MWVPTCHDQGNFNRGGVATSSGVHPPSTSSTSKQELPQPPQGTLALFSTDKGPVMGLLLLLSSHVLAHTALKAVASQLDRK